MLYGGSGDDDVTTTITPHNPTLTFLLPQAGAVVFEQVGPIPCYDFRVPSVQVAYLVHMFQRFVKEEKLAARARPAYQPQVR